VVAQVFSNAAFSLILVKSESQGIRQGHLVRKLITPLLLGQCLFASAGAAAEKQPTIRELIEQLRTGELLAQQDAAQALEKRGADAVEAIPALTAVLPHAGLQRPATRALFAIGPEGVRAFYARISRNYPYDFNPDLKQTAALTKRPNTVLGFVTTVRKRPDFFLGSLPFDPTDKNLRYFPVPFGYGSGLSRSYEKRYESHTPSVLALPALIRALKDDRAEVRITAAEALERMGPAASPATSALLDSLRDPWPLTEIGPNHRPYGIRAAAVDTLLSIGPAARDRLMREGVPLLVDGLRTDNVVIRRHTAAALGRLGPQARPAAALLAESLMSYGEPFLTPKKALESHGIAGGSILSACPERDTLRAIGAGAVPALLPLLSRKEESARRQALVALGAIGARAKAACKAVLPLTHAGSAKTRYFALRTLARIAPGANETHRVLIVALHDQDEDVRALAAFMLGRIGPRASVAILALQRVAKTDRAMARIASEALGAIRGKPLPPWPWKKAPAERRTADTADSLPRLMELLFFVQADYRQDAAKRLGQLGPAAGVAVPRLIQSLSDEDERVRVYAAAALIRITGDQQPYRSILRRGLHETIWAADAIASVGTDWSLATLLEAVKHPATELGCGDAIPQLSVGTLEENYRWQAFGAIGQMGEAARPAVPELVRMLTEERVSGSNRFRDTKLMILCTLQALGPTAKEALPLLFDMRRSEEGWVAKQVDDTIRSIEAKR
jgi:HEAT repeat protein